MTTLIQSLSWAMVQSFVQGVLVYLVLSVLLWTIPAGMARLRYRLSFFAMLALFCGFIISWRGEYHVLATLTNAPLVTLPSGSLLRASAGTLVVPGLMGYRFLPFLGGAYIIGILLMMVRLVAGVSQVLALSRRGTQTAPVDTGELFAELKKKLAISHPVRLLISVRTRVPMVVGVLKPVVLLPFAATAQLEPGQLEAILLHELAHVKRYDYLANIMQAAIETVLFFNPFVWLISSGLRDERECCCDDMVVNAVEEPISYATALAALASSHAGTGTFAVAATGQSDKLFARVQRIMEARDLRLNYSKMVASLVLLLLVIGSVAWVKPAFNHKVRKTGEKTQAKKTQDVSHDKHLKEVQANVGGVEGKAASTGNPHPPVETATAGKQAAKVTQQQVALTDENILVNRLLQDRVVDQVRGFLVERHFDELYINRQRLPVDVSAKYLQGLSRNIFRVQVFPLEERMRMHPEADFIQLLLPFTFESPCIQKAPQKEEGC